jgi:hypothetical protein
MTTQAQRKEIQEGQAIIAKAGLGSEAFIEASNTWRCVVRLKHQLGRRSMRIHEVQPEHLVEWIR